MNTSRKYHEFLLKRYPDAAAITSKISGLLPEQSIANDATSAANSFITQLTSSLPAYPVNKDPFNVLQRTVSAIFYRKISAILSHYDHLLSEQKELAQDLCQQSVHSLPERIRRLCSLAGKINQTTPQRFTGWEELFGQYPAIMHALAQHHRHIMINLTDVLAKLDKDKELLINTFKISLFSIKKIALSLGDMHQTGKSVARIDFSRGSVVYKPRSADNEAFILALLDLLNAEIMQIRIGIPAFINMHEYSWHENITYQNAENEQQVIDYYRNIGAALLFFHLINGADFDQKNIICVKNTPYFIDSGKIFSCPLQRSIFTHSILNTAIIPSLAGNPSDRYDCGIGIPADGKVDIIWQKNLMEGKSEVPFRQESFNIPLPCHAGVAHGVIIKAINDGFDNMRQLIKNNQKIISFIHSYPSLKGRVELRSRHAYLDIMQLISHPAYETDLDARNIFLSSLLYDETKSLDVMQYEHRAISDGRIPLFYMDLVTGKYSTSEGQQLNISGNHSFKHYMKKVFRMINTDEESAFQKKLINFSLDTLYPGRIASNKKSDFFEKTIDFMAGEEIPYNKKEYILNIATDVNGAKIIHSLNSDIYNGLSGAVFLQLCNTIVNRSPLKEQKLQRLYLRANKYNTRETFGCFEMNGGLLYLEYLFYKNLISWFDISMFNKRLFDIINIIRKNDAHADIFSGIAGVLIVCSRMYLLCPQRIYESAIKYLAATLMHKAIRIDNDAVAWRNKETGFARGNSGIIYALLLANNILNNKEINQLVVNALKYEQRFKTSNGWKSEIMPDREEDVNCWYQGAAGIYMSRTAMLDENYFEGKEITDILSSDIEHYNNTKKERPINQNPSLGHGIYGNAMIDPLSYAEFLQVNYSSYAQSEDKSLMRGRPGAFYAYLFINENNRQLPNLLLLK